MTKKTINVPLGIKYLTDWEGFELPHGIFNKVETGCGGSEFFLRQRKLGVMVSPRVQLIENKHAQHPDTTVLVCGKKTANEANVEIEALREKGIYLKILTTPDSLPKVLTIIDPKEYDLLYDEYHLLLSDASFKSEIGLEALAQIGKFKKATLMSATPLMEEVTKDISELSKLPYTELKWAKRQLYYLIRIKSNCPQVAVLPIIRNYKEGEYPTITNDEGKILHESHEAVIFLNSVKGILNIIMQTGLAPDDVNIIIGKNEENLQMLRDLSKKMGKTYEYGSAPLKGEPHKMITLATATAYQGVDFYNESGMVFVINDVNAKNTCVGIEHELQQIAGRLRLDSNPFRRYIYLIYNTSMGKMRENDFNQQMAEKIKLTIDEITNDNATQGKLREKRIRERRKEQQAICYSSTFTRYNEKKKCFEINTLKVASEKHEFRVQQKYKSDMLVKELEKTGKFKVDNTEKEYFITEQIANIISRTTFEEKMKRYCEYKEGGKGCINFLIQSLTRNNKDIIAFYDILGAETCKNLQYKKAYLEQAVVNRKNHNNILEAYKETFVIDSEWNTAEIRNHMTQINGEKGFLVRGKAPKGSVASLVRDWGFEIEHNRKTKKYKIISHPPAGNSADAPL